MHRSNTALQFVKIALNAWELRAAKGLLSPGSIERLAPGLQRIKQLPNIGTNHIMGFRPLVDRVTQNRQLLNPRLINAQVPRFTEPVIRSPGATSVPARLPIQFKNSLLTNPDSMRRYSAIKDVEPFANRPAQPNRFPIRTTDNPLMAAFVSAMGAPIDDSLSAKLFHQFQPKRSIIAGSNSIMRRHEIGHFMDFKAPYQKRILDLYRTARTMGKNYPEGNNVFLSRLASNPTYSTEILGQRQAVLNAPRNARAQSVVDTTLQGHQSPAVQAMPDAVHKSIMAHLERNYNFNGPVSAPPWGFAKEHLPVLREMWKDQLGYDPKW